MKNFKVVQMIQSSLSWWNTLWKKEKMLITNISFNFRNGFNKPSAMEVFITQICVIRMSQGSFAGSVNQDHTAHSSNANTLKMKKKKKDHTAQNMWSGSKIRQQDLNMSDLESKLSYTGLPLLKISFKAAKFGFWRTIGLHCYHSLRITYLAYYVFGKSRANPPPIKFNFSVFNAFFWQPAV